MTEEIIDYDNVSIELEGKMILHNISLQLAKGEFCFIIGKTGSGKSTLLKSFYGASKISEGDAIVLNQNMKELLLVQRPKHRRRIGVVLQESLLLESETIYDNLLVALQAVGNIDIQSIGTRIDEALMEVNLKLDSSEVVSKLSAGQKQRVALARAIINSPEIIVADEPTGNLDDDASANFMTLLFNIAMQKKTSVIISSHDSKVLSNYPARTFKVEEHSIKEI